MPVAGAHQFERLIVYLIIWSVCTLLSASLSVFVIESRGLNVSKLRAKKPKVPGCVLSVPPPPHPATGSLFTHRVDHVQVVVNIPAGLNHKPKVSVVDWFQRE